MVQRMVTLKHEEPFFFLSSPLGCLGVLRFSLGEFRIEGRSGWWESWK